MEAASLMLSPLACGPGGVQASAAPGRRRLQGIRRPPARARTLRSSRAAWRRQAERPKRRNANRRRKAAGVDRCSVPSTGTGRAGSATPSIVTSLEGSEDRSLEHVLVECVPRVARPPSLGSSCISKAAQDVQRSSAATSGSCCHSRVVGVLRREERTRPKRPTCDRLMPSSSATNFQPTLAPHPGQNTSATDMGPCASCAGCVGPTCTAASMAFTNQACSTLPPMGLQQC
mmetsp:Transcript_104138/g.311006  ORF Transcript_104138/g.311006 Transcript_104138/m.311006 type:complete len:231 (+) Transcript_104138:116-808(+)